MDELTWRAKEKEKVSGGSGSMAVVPYEHKLHNKPLLITEDKASRNVNQRSGGERSGKGELKWREKTKENASLWSSSMDVAPYEHMPSNKPQSIIVDRPYRSEGHRY